MSETRNLSSQPSSILQEWLISARGIGSDPSSGSEWPVFYGFLPDTPANAIGIFDVVGTNLGRIQTSGEGQGRFGITIMVRAKDSHSSGSLAYRIAHDLHTYLKDTEVTLGSVTYIAKSFITTSGPIDLGAKTPATPNRIYTVNGIVDIVVKPEEAATLLNPSLALKNMTLDEAWLTIYNTSPAPTTPSYLDKEGALIYHKRIGNIVTEPWEDWRDFEENLDSRLDRLGDTRKNEVISIAPNGNTYDINPHVVHNGSGTTWSGTGITNLRERAAISWKGPAPRTLTPASEIRQRFDTYGEDVWLQPRSISMWRAPDELYFYDEDPVSGEKMLWADDWLADMLTVMPDYWADLKTELDAHGYDPQVLAIDLEDKTWTYWDFNAYPNGRDASFLDPRMADINSDLSFDVDAAEWSTWNQAPGWRLNEKVWEWNSLMYRRYFSIYYKAYMDELWKVFPNIKVFNYDSSLIGYGATDTSQCQAGQAYFLDKRTSWHWYGHYNFEGEIGSDSRALSNHRLYHGSAAALPNNAFYSWDQNADVISDTDNGFTRFTRDVVRARQTYLGHNGHEGSSHYLHWVQPNRYGPTTDTPYWVVYESWVLALMQNRKHGPYLWLQSGWDQSDYDNTYNRISAICDLLDTAIGTREGVFHLLAVPPITSPLASPNLGFYAMYQVNVGTKVITRVVWDPDNAVATSENGVLKLTHNVTGESRFFTEFGTVMLQGDGQFLGTDEDLTNGVFLELT